jgi:hypothetical protein
MCFFSRPKIPPMPPPPTQVPQAKVEAPQIDYGTPGDEQTNMVKRNRAGTRNFRVDLAAPSGSAGNGLAIPKL